jgi:antitoxin MazE
MNPASSMGNPFRLALMVMIYRFCCAPNSRLAPTPFCAYSVITEAIMKSRIVKIGNSRGIRIPKALLEAVGLEGEVDLAVRSGSLVIRPARACRAGWAESFQEMAANGDDAMLDDVTLLTNWDEEEWEWR